MHAPCVIVEYNVTMQLYMFHLYPDITYEVICVAGFIPLRSQCT